MFTLPAIHFRNNSSLLRKQANWLINQTESLGKKRVIVGARFRKPTLNFEGHFQEQKLSFLHSKYKLW